MKQIGKIFTLLTVFCSFTAHADVQLSFTFNGPDIQSSSRTFSISRFFARIDDPAQPDLYLLYQAGKFFPLYRVDTSAKSYTRLTPAVKPTLHAGIKPESRTNEDRQPGESADMAAAETLTDPAKPMLRLTKQSKTIAGIRCLVVEELAGDKIIKSHCMADQSHLAMTEREVRTLARLFSMARERKLGWLGTSTHDERFVSIASEDLQSQKTLRLSSVSHSPLPAGYLRVPRTYTEAASLPAGPTQGR